MHRLLLIVFLFFVFIPELEAQVLDKTRILESQTYLDNRDWEWYSNNIPFFECPDEDITKTYYYRWELLTKHLTYGSPTTGYVFTEFIDRPFWSGAYGAISCPAGHQLYESRWLKSPKVAHDYSRYWFRTPGAQPRNYSTWLADSVWAVDQVHPAKDWATGLLPDLIKNYEAWEQRHFVPEVGLFWQTGHDDGMEFNINSRQSQDILRGAPSYRPTFNAYMWADAMAISKIALRSGDGETSERYKLKADRLLERMQALLWDPKRQFFFPMLRNDENRDGHSLRKGTLTYQSGKYAGDTHGRELIGFVPWQFNMLDRGKGFETAWSKLMDRDGFYAEFGPLTVERNDPMFLLQKSCCWWSGQSWPYATSQTLKALANVLQQTQPPSNVSASDYLKVLQTFAKSHRKDGRPYLAEALHPDTGSFEGHDNYNHSEHYFHSSYCDLIITGLVGLVPRDDDTIELHPLAPSTWDYFALDDVRYHGRNMSILWDRNGTRYGLGKGLQLRVDGKTIATNEMLKPLTAKLPSTRVAIIEKSQAMINYAVNNDGLYYPRITASATAPNSSVSKLIDGNYWYVLHPPNRWTSEGSTNTKDWLELDLGAERLLSELVLYFLDDELDDKKDGSSKVRSPRSFEVQVWDKDSWQTIEKWSNDSLTKQPVGHRATRIELGNKLLRKLRVNLEHDGDYRSGLTELEAWGPTLGEYVPASAPEGNLAFNAKGTGFPKATASHSDRFGGLPMKAIDGQTNFLPTPMNRWTSYESKSQTDWLEIEFERAMEFRRVELAIYDDHGGVQPPLSFRLETWQDQAWKPLVGAQKVPARPQGGVWNEVRFAPTTSSKLRIVFENAGQARSGVSEVMVWNE
jgi:hypothetical protein